MGKQSMIGGTQGVSRRAFLEGLGVLGLGLALGACSSSEAASDGAGSTSTAAAGSSAGAASSSSAGTSAASTSAAAGGKTLVAYFSGSGHTQRVAEELASQLGADVFQIEPAQPYTSDDLNYNDDSSRVSQEHEDEGLQDVELAQSAPDNFADYDRVLVGYPIWWGDSAWAMHRFASDNDFTGKTVIPFCTSFSSSLGQSGQNLADRAGTGDWQEGMRFDQDVDLSEVDTWAEGLSA